MDLLCSGLTISPALVFMYSIPLKKPLPLMAPHCLLKKNIWLTSNWRPWPKYCLVLWGHLLRLLDPALISLDNFHLSIMFSFSISGDVRTCTWGLNSGPMFLTTTYHHPVVHSAIMLVLVYFPRAFSNSYHLRRNVYTQFYGTTYWTLY